MKNRNNMMRIFAFLLLAAMLVSSFAACNGVTITPNTTTTTTTTNPAGPDGPNPPVHICQFGEWQLVKEATSTESGLSERKCEECGKTEQLVIPPYVREYTITYVDAPQHNNPTKYTVNDYIDLQKAVWNGLSFAYWTDKDGNIIQEIPYGTEGNITLYANWRLTENFAYSNNSNEILTSLYDEENNYYYFVYEIGSISGVVLDEIASCRYNATSSHTWSFSETVSFQESEAKTVADTVSKSITNSSSWDSAVSSAASISLTNSTTTGGSVGINIKGVVSAGVHKSKGKELSVGASSTTSISVGGSSSSSSESSKSVSSSITFVTDTSTQITRTETLDPSISLPGLYTYAQVGTLFVFVVVTYDIDAKDYYTNIYSYIDEVSEAMLYKPTPEYNGDLRLVDSEPFEFDIDIDALAKTVSNAYYIEFDANGGTGSMPTQMMLPDIATELFENKFTKAGNAFVGWRVKEGDKTKVYLDGQEVTDIGSPKETVILEAVWASTEPVWNEKETQVYYYAEMPSGFDQSHELYAKYNNNALESGIDGNTKIVVEEAKLYTYIYWHWVRYQKAPDNRYIGSYYGEKFNVGSAQYFNAFESTENCPNTDPAGEGGGGSHIFYCNRVGSLDCSWWWYRIPVYVQTYTIYELVE